MTRAAVLGAVRESFNSDLFADLSPADEARYHVWLASATPDDIFDRWCDYEGLINYGPTLRNVLAILQEGAE